MSFQIQILSVRSSQAEGRKLTINQTPTGYTVVGRLYQANGTTKVDAKMASGFEDCFAGAKVTVKMNDKIQAQLNKAASALYEIEQTPFYMLTFEVKGLVRPQWNDNWGYNISVEASNFIEVSASTIEPDMMNEVFKNIYSQDAAERSAVAVETNRQLRAQLQNQVVEAAMQQETTKNRRGRKPKAVEA